MSEEDSYEIEWLWEGELRAAVLRDGTVVRSGGLLDLREKVVSVLAERRVTSGYIYFRQVGTGQERRTRRR